MKHVLGALRRAAFLAVRNGAQALNLNTGSGALKVQYSDDSIGGGSALINEPEFVRAAVEVMRQGAHDALFGSKRPPEGFLFPVSVKTRLAEDKEKEDVPPGQKKAYNKKRAADFLRVVAKAKPSWIDVHTRTPEDAFDNRAIRNNRTLFRDLIEEVGPDLPPIFMNGNINGKEDLTAFMEISGRTHGKVHGVMIGRQMLNSTQGPFWLRHAAAVIHGQDVPQTSLLDQLETIRRFLDLKEERLGSKFYWESRIRDEIARVFRVRVAAPSKQKLLETIAEKLENAQNAQAAAALLVQAREILQQLPVGGERAELRQTAARQKASGTFFLSRSELRKMNETQIKALHLAMQTTQGLRLVIFGEDSLLHHNSADDPSAAFSRYKNVMLSPRDALSAVDYAVPNQPLIYLTHQRLDSARRRPFEQRGNVFFMLLGDSYDSILLARLVVASGGQALKMGLRLEDGYLSDPNGIYHTLSDELFRSHLIAVAA